MLTDKKWERKIRQYLQEIITEEWFVNLNKLVHFFDEDDSIEEKIQKVMEYAKRKYTHYKTKRVDYKKLHSVLESYRTMQDTSFDNENHYLSFDYNDVLWRRQNNGGHYLLGCAVIVKKGEYIPIYIKRAPRMRTLPSMPKLAGGTESELRIDSNYNAIISSYIGEMLGIPTVKYFLVQYGKNELAGVGSKDFLKNNQKLVTFQEIINYYKEHKSDYQESEEYKKDPKTYTVQLLDALVFYLKDKYKLSDKRVEELVSDFLEQETFARIISLADGKPENSALIIETDNDGNESVVSIAPAFDLDFSLYMGKSIVDYWKRGLVRREANDNRSELEIFIKTIGSLCDSEGALYDKQGAVKRFVESNMQNFQNPQFFCQQLFERIASEGILIPKGTKNRTIRYIEDTFRCICLIHDSIRNEDEYIIESDSLGLNEHN